MSSVSVIQYREGFIPQIEEIIRLFEDSGINRPTNDHERISKMFANANLVITAWHCNALIGVCRALTDYSYCCYLSDLAVDKLHQRQGVGQKMINMVKHSIGEQATLILLSAEPAMSYYPAIGFERIENGFIIKRKN